MITFTIDTLTPCLKETSTGEIYETEVIRLKRKSFLAKFNKRTGWYVNWSKFEDGVEKTLEEVGQTFGVTRERIRQIESKALRKLSHPTRIRKLKDFL